MSLIKRNTILNGHVHNKIWTVLLTDIAQTAQSSTMKPNKTRNNKSGYVSDDDNIRYKLNTKYFNSLNKPTKSEKLRIVKYKAPKNIAEEDNNIRYKLPALTNKINVHKAKGKPKIKVKFWSAKKRSNNNDNITKPKSVKVRKKVSVFPSPLYSDELVPMVTVPDDLTVQLNEDEVRDLAQELSCVDTDIISANSGTHRSQLNKNDNSLKRKSRNSTTQTSPKSTKRTGTLDTSQSIIHNYDSELEFFSKYVVQKLRRMDTNQRIYSENLINTVLMWGQLGKLNGKCKVTDVQNNVS